MLNNFKINTKEGLKKKLKKLMSSKSLTSPLNYLILIKLLGNNFSYYVMC